MCCAVLSHSVMSWTVAHQAPLSMGILQARILEWVDISSSRVSSQPWDWIQVSHIAGRFFNIGATKEAQEYWSWKPIPSPGDLPDPGIELGSPALQAVLYHLNCQGSLFVFILLSKCIYLVDRDFVNQCINTYAFFGSLCFLDFEVRKKFPRWDDKSSKQYISAAFLWDIPSSMKS